MRARSMLQIRGAAGDIVRGLRASGWKVALALVGLMSISAGDAAAQNSPSGFQVTPDATRALINKDVGAERWAITNNKDENTITGNVFFAGPVAMPPQFLACTVENVNPEENIATLFCSSAPPCAEAPCLDTNWGFVGEIEVPEDFIDPELRL